MRDLETGTTTLVSVNHAGTDSSTGDVSTFVLSADGAEVAFVSASDGYLATRTEIRTATPATGRPPRRGDR